MEEESKNWDLPIVNKDCCYIVQFTQRFKDKYGHYLIAVDKEYKIGDILSYDETFGVKYKIKHVKKIATYFLTSVKPLEKRAVIPEHTLQIGIRWFKI